MREPCFLYRSRGGTVYGSTNFCPGRILALPSSLLACCRAWGDTLLALAMLYSVSPALTVTLPPLALAAAGAGFPASGLAGLASASPTAVPGPPTATWRGCGVKSSPAYAGALHEWTGRVHETPPECEAVSALGTGRPSEGRVVHDGGPGCRVRPQRN